MATKDGFALVRSEHSGESGRPDVGKTWDRTVILSRILKTGILAATAAAIVFGIWSLGNPRVLVADAAAFLVPASAPRNGTDQSTPSIQATAVQDLPSSASAAPTGEETAAALKAADQKQTEIGEPPAGTYLSLFRAWAANEDARAEAPPAQPEQDAQPQPAQDAQPQPAQDAQPRPVQDVRPQIRPVQRHRQVWRVRNAQAEIRFEQNRAKMRRKQHAQVQARRLQDTQAEEPPAPQAPSFLQSLGLQN